MLFQKFYAFMKKRQETKYLFGQLNIFFEQLYNLSKTSIFFYKFFSF